jgi:hypothetical protein
MIQVDQDLQPALDDVVRLSALDVDDEAHAARVMLVARIVQSWSRRGSHHGALDRLRFREHGSAVRQADGSQKQTLASALLRCNDQAGGSA